MIHILTGEYPPGRCGVGDYSSVVAAELAMANQGVHVWTRGRKKIVVEGGVNVHRSAGRFSAADLCRLGEELDAMPRPRRLIVQWAPYSFGFRGMNLWLSVWIWKPANLNRDVVELMVHEPFAAFGEGDWRQNIVAAVHRSMIVMLLLAASKVWIAIPAWERCLKPWSFGKSSCYRWLPVPTNLETRSGATCIRTARPAPNPGQQLTVGHFATFLPEIARLLEPAFERILETSNVSVLLAGSGSIDFRARLIAKLPHAAGRVVATGALPAAHLTAHLSGCHALLQPYPDGITSRRSSAMAALALGVPLITNPGPLSEDFWPASGAIFIAASASAADLADAVLHLVRDSELRNRLSASALDLYQERFDVRHTISALLGFHGPTS